MALDSIVRKEDSSSNVLGLERERCGGLGGWASVASLR